MNNLREVNDDILKDWLDFREDTLSSLTCEEDKKHWIYFEEISERILKNVPEQNSHYDFFLFMYFFRNIVVLQLLTFILF